MELSLGERGHREFMSASEEISSAQIVDPDQSIEIVDQSDHNVLALITSSKSDGQIQDEISDQSSKQFDKSFSEIDQINHNGNQTENKSEKADLSREQIDKLGDYDLVVDFNAHDQVIGNGSQFIDQFNDHSSEKSNVKSLHTDDQDDDQTQYSCIIVVTSEQSNQINSTCDHRTTVSLPYIDHHKSNSSTHDKSSKPDNRTDNAFDLHFSEVSDTSEGNYIHTTGEVHHEGLQGRGFRSLQEHDASHTSHQSAKIQDNSNLETHCDSSPRVNGDTRKRIQVDSILRTSGDSSPRIPVDSALKISSDSSPRIPVDSILRISSNSSSRIPSDSNLRIPNCSSPRIPSDSNLRIPSDSSPRIPVDSILRISNGSSPRIPIDSRLHNGPSPRNDDPGISDNSSPRIPSHSGGRTFGAKRKSEDRSNGRPAVGSGRTKPVLSPARESRLLFEESSQQICIDIQSQQDVSSVPVEEGEAKSTWTPPPLLLISFIKMVDVGFHGTMLGLLLYATYLSAVFCHQSLDESLCLKNSSLSPQILGKPEWIMPVRDWSLIFSIFHSVYFFLAILADLFFFKLLTNIKKYILTVLPVDRGFLVVLLLTDSTLYIFSGNLSDTVGGLAVTVLVTLAATSLLVDTAYVLPRLIHLSRLDLVWLLQSSQFLSRWRPCIHLTLVICMTLYNLLSTLQQRLSAEVIPLVVFGCIYSAFIILFIILVIRRKKGLYTFLATLNGNTEAPNTPRDWPEGRAEPPQEARMDPKEWAEGRSDLALGILGLASVNYLSVAPIARTLNFIFNTFVL